MISDECGVFYFSLNNSNVNLISLWFLPMLFSSAQFSFFWLFWRQNCEFQTGTVVVCVYLLIPVISPLLFQAGKKVNVTFLGSGQSTAAFISLALPLASDQTIYSAWETPNTGCVCVIHGCVYAVCVRVYLSLSDPATLWCM